MTELNSDSIVLRSATEADLKQLAKLFVNTIRMLGPAFYSPSQIDAWATGAEDAFRFRNWILSAETLVAEYQDEVLGFCGLAADGHITGLYVDASWTRKGIGAKLLGAVLELARQKQILRCYAEANPFSLPVFQRLGFVQTGSEIVERHGQQFTRELVEKHSPLWTESC